MTWSTSSCWRTAGEKNHVIWRNGQSVSSLFSNPRVLHSALLSIGCLTSLAVGCISRSSIPHINNSRTSLRLSQRDAANEFDPSCAKHSWRDLSGRSLVSANLCTTTIAQAQYGLVPLKFILGPQSCLSRHPNFPVREIRVYQHVCCAEWNKQEDLWKDY